MRAWISGLSQNPGGMVPRGPDAGQLPPSGHIPRVSLPGHAAPAPRPRSWSVTGCGLPEGGRWGAEPGQDGRGHGRQPPTWRPAPLVRQRRPAPSRSPSLGTKVRPPRRTFKTPHSRFRGDHVSLTKNIMYTQKMYHVLSPDLFLRPAGGGIPSSRLKAASAPPARSPAPTSPAIALPTHRPTGPWADRPLDT